MSQVRQIPTLRFSEFSEDWEINPFKNLVKISQGLQINISDRLIEQEEGSLFYITNEFLREKSEKKYFIKNAPESVICDKDDVLMTRTGNTGKVVTNVKGAFHNNFFKIAYPKSINKDFLVNFLNLQQTQNFILRLAGTSTIPDLNHSDFYKINFVYPKKEEQQKIASFLSSVDEKINLLQQKKTLLEDYKKGVMQQIFSQELRFAPKEGGEYPEWEEKKLGEVATKESSNISANKIEENIGKYKIYGASGLLKKIDFYREEKSYISIVKDGAGVGRTLLCEAKSSVLGTLDIIKPKINANLYFIYSLLNNIDFTKYITGSTIPHIYFKHYSKEKIKIPSIKEQTQIANFLSALDEKIGLVSSQIENTQEFKKGLLQQMFV